MTSREGRPARAGARWWPPDPVRVADLVQAGKTALAGVLAWVVATDVLHLQQAFLAPWSAVLVVHATVFRTVARGGQQVAATFLGIGLAWVCGQLLGVGAAAMAVMLVASFALGSWRWWRVESMTIATTGIVVLTTNAVAHDNVLVSRLVDSTVGVVIGLAVNLAVWPPLRDRAAWARLDELPTELAEVLQGMATALGPDLEEHDAEAWVSRLREIDVRVDQAWGLLRAARESGRLNLRRARPAGLEQMDAALHLLEQAGADELSMARTIATSARDQTMWSGEFRLDWARLLTATADAVRRDDVDALRRVRDEIGQVVQGLSTDSLAQAAWHEYGGLLVNLRNVVHALGEVTAWAGRADPSTRREQRFRVRGAGLVAGARGYRPHDDH